jgi:hypothetical protein
MIHSEIKNARITSSASGIHIVGELNEATGGLIHLQNFIAKFGGSVSLVSGKYSSRDEAFTFYSYSYNDPVTSMNYRFMVNVSQDTYDKQLRVWGDDLIRFEPVELTLMDNSYLILPDEKKYWTLKKSMVN